MLILDGVVPYSVAVGNHDLFNGGDTEDRAESVKIYNQYFPPSRYECTEWYGGHMGEGNENSFSFFKAGGMEFMVLSLEYYPRDTVLAWANQVVSENEDHAYMSIDDTRIGEDSNWGPQSHTISRDDGNHGEEMWEEFVKFHPNFFLVLSGHALGDGVGRLTSTGVEGNEVHQLLANYQARQVAILEGGRIR